MKELSTDLDREQRGYKDDPQVTKFHLISMAVSFLVGCILGAFLIMAVMKIFVG